MPGAGTRTGAGFTCADGGGADGASANGDGVLFRVGSPMDYIQHWSPARGSFFFPKAVSSWETRETITPGSLPECGNSRPEKTIRV
jgi:hypothetical protein